MASDAELIAASLAGDGEAFVEVIRRHEVAVGAYLVRRAGRELTEDLLGEVWVAAFGSRAAYDQSFPGAARGCSAWPTTRSGGTGGPGQPRIPWPT